MEVQRLRLLSLKTASTPPLTTSCGIEYVDVVISFNVSTDIGPFPTTAFLELNLFDGKIVQIHPGTFEYLDLTPTTVNLYTCSYDYFGLLDLSPTQCELPRLEEVPLGEEKHHHHRCEPDRGLQAKITRLVEKADFDKLEFGVVPSGVITPLNHISFRSFNGSYNLDVNVINGTDNYRVKFWPKRIVGLNKLRGSAVSVIESPGSKSVNVQLSVPRGLVKFEGTLQLRKNLGKTHEEKLSLTPISNPVFSIDVFLDDQDNYIPAAVRWFTKVVFPLTGIDPVDFDVITIVSNLFATDLTITKDQIADRIFGGDPPRIQTYPSVLRDPDHLVAIQI